MELRAVTITNKSTSPRTRVSIAQERDHNLEKQRATEPPALKLVEFQFKPNPKETSLLKAI